MFQGSAGFVVLSEPLVDNFCITLISNLNVTIQKGLRKDVKEVLFVCKRENG
jgi:hypothetical protein